MEREWRKEKKEDIPNSIYTIVITYNTYEDYLETQISEENLKYFEDEEIAKKLVELGYWGTGKALKREEFYYWKKYAEKLRNENRKIVPIYKPRTETFTDEFLQALAEREVPNLNGDMSSILFLRTINNKGQEISSYIDLAHRLETEDFQLYFSGKRKLIPQYDDLSFCNWVTRYCVKNCTPHYDVIVEKLEGIQFKHTGDGYIITVASENPGEDTFKRVIRSPSYYQIVFYDHLVRRKIVQ
ncbi:uncharacterized protein C4orf22 homolog [Centruroides sculpturatus]|uniref:uncharacterized protein C4orf22 homolog n=1 Tax=Centruroides sculpturatus TaxID=218467 RepID=UPI000C6CD27C|nr:uncharacterized protein C4orf22 homolog [Centruroides sculpturatus]